MRCATSPTRPTGLITRRGHNPFEEENPMSRLKSLAVFAALAGTLVAGNAFALQVSTNDGGSYGAALTEAADADAFTFTAGVPTSTVSVTLSNLNEGDGDGTNCPAQAANAIRVRFQATKN